MFINFDSQLDATRHSSSTFGFSLLKGGAVAPPFPPLRRAHARTRTKRARARVRAGFRIMCIFIDNRKHT